MNAENPHFRDRIIIDPEIMVGKPIIKGTRIPVELVFNRLAQNPDVTAVLQSYPRLTIDDIKACLEYAQSLVEGESLYPTPA